MRSPRLRPFIFPIIVFVCVTLFFAYNHTLTFRGFFLSLIGIIAISLAFIAMDRGPWI